MKYIRNINLQSGDTYVYLPFAGTINGSVYASDASRFGKIKVSFSNGNISDISAHVVNMNIPYSFFGIIKDNSSTYWDSYGQDTTLLPLILQAETMSPVLAHLEDDIIEIPNSWITNLEPASFVDIKDNVYQNVGNKKYYNGTENLVLSSSLGACPQLYSLTSSIITALGGSIDNYGSTISNYDAYGNIAYINTELTNPNGCYAFNGYVSIGFSNMEYVHNFINGNISDDAIIPRTMYEVLLDSNSSKEQYRLITFGYVKENASYVLEFFLSHVLAALNLIGDESKIKTIGSHDGMEFAFVTDTSTYFVNIFTNSVLYAVSFDD